MYKFWLIRLFKGLFTLKIRFSLKKKKKNHNHAQKPHSTAIRAMISFFMHLRCDLHFLYHPFMNYSIFWFQIWYTEATKLVYRWLLWSSCLLVERCLILPPPLTCARRKKPDKASGLPLGVVNGLGRLVNFYLAHDL